MFVRLLCTIVSELMPTSPVEGPEAADTINNIYLAVWLSRELLSVLCGRPHCYTGFAAICGPAYTFWRGSSCPESITAQQ